MEQTFYPKTKDFAWNQRPITIKIAEDWITFHFKNEQDREFYDIPKRDWISDRKERLDREDNWHYHMKEKNWFTKEMEKYIDENV
jgi:hypothetical protein